MKPAPFVYVAPGSLAEVLEALGEHGADGKILAGGQSLVPMMNMRLARPAALIDITRVPGLSGIRRGARLTIGATTRQAHVLADPDIAFDFPLIHAALMNVGHPAIRARGTLGGSVAHADPAGELPAVMLALGAELVVHGPRGERLVDVDDFYLTYYTTDLAPDEVLVEVLLPAQAPSVWGFREVARRHGDFALSGAVVACQTNGGGVVTSARVVLFGVTDRPVRALRTEEALIGTALDAAAVRHAASLAPDRIEFASDIHVPGVYREEASVALVRRALEDAGRRRENGA